MGIDEQLQAAGYAGPRVAAGAVEDPVGGRPAVTGEAIFTNGFDPDPRTRSVFAFHCPGTLARWIRAWHAGTAGGSMRARLQRLGPVSADGLRRTQQRGVAARARGVDEGQTARGMRTCREFGAR